MWLLSCLAFTHAVHHRDTAGMVFMDEENSDEEYAEEKCSKTADDKQTPPAIGPCQVVGPVFDLEVSAIECGAGKVQFADHSALLWGLRAEPLLPSQAEGALPTDVVPLPVEVVEPVVGKKKSSESPKVSTFPSSLMPDLVKLVEGNHTSVPAMIAIMHEKALAVSVDLTFASIKRVIHRIASKQALPGFKACYHVKEHILKQCVQPLCPSCFSCVCRASCDVLTCVGFVLACVM